MALSMGGPAVRADETMLKKNVLVFCNIPGPMVIKLLTAVSYEFL